MSTIFSSAVELAQFDVGSSACCLSIPVKTALIVESRTTAGEASCVPRRLGWRYTLPSTLDSASIHGADVRHGRWVSLRCERETACACLIHAGDTKNVVFGDQTIQTFQRRGHNIKYTPST